MRVSNDFEQQLNVIELRLDLVPHEPKPLPNVARMCVLRERFKLSGTEADILWYLAASAARPRVRSLIVSTTGELICTTEVLRTLVFGDAVDARAFRELSSDSKLIRAMLVEEHRLDASRRVWTATPRIMRWLCGEDDKANRQPVAIGNPVVGTSVVTTLIEGMHSSNSLLVLVGVSGAGRRTVARTAAATIGKDLFEVDVSALPPEADDLKRELTLLARECLLTGGMPLLCNVGTNTDERGNARLRAVATHFAVAIEGPILVTAPVNYPAMRWDRPMVVLEIKPPTSACRAALWHHELGQGTQEDAEFLATQYPLAPALIHHAAKGAKARANGRKMQPEDIYAGIRAVLDDKLGDYAKRVEVTQTWDDLVLPEDQMEAVQYLIARIRQRRTVYEQWGFAAKVGKGLGTSALFSGPPGTGKTMVAALIAKELGLELYQVDMAKITSKYIGETERNLAALFDAAEAGHAILLFDEADSLFGKRTEVKSSNDRYANLETNYLLQRLESFTGICLLTSNHESNIDPAFQRRLSLHVRFDVPEAEERESLWRAMLPTAAPVAASVDFAGLARRFVMSGGYIRNAALRAAFLAADEGTEITAKHLERAAKLEYEGMGKVAYQAA